MRRLIIGMTGSTGAIFGVRMLEALKGSRRRDPSHHQQMGAAHPRARDPLHRRAGARARDRRAQPGRHGRVDLVGLVQDRRHGGDALLGAHARRHRQRLRRAPGASRRRRRCSRSAGRLVLVVRETPLSEVHLENMLKLARMGVVDRAADAGVLQSSADASTTSSTTSSRACSTSSTSRRRSPSAGTATCTPRPRSPAVPNPRAVREERDVDHRPSGTSVVVPAKAGTQCCTDRLRCPLTRA